MRDPTILPSSSTVGTIAFAMARLLEMLALIAHRVFRCIIIVRLSHHHRHQSRTLSRRRLLNELFNPADIARNGATAKFDGKKKRRRSYRRKPPHMMTISQMARPSLGRNSGGGGGGDRSVKSSWDVEGDNEDDDWFGDIQQSTGGDGEDRAGGGREDGDSGWKNGGGER